MSRISQDPRLPIPGSPNFDSNLYNQLNKLHRELATQLNLLSEGSIQSCTTAMAAAPTTGKWQKGDEIRNTAPSELGTGGSKYIIRGWICTSAGEPGTWLQQRVLTGN